MLSRSSSDSIVAVLYFLSIKTCQIGVVDGMMYGLKIASVHKPHCFLPAVQATRHCQ